jgi:hypothetical protein
MTDLAELYRLNSILKKTHVKMVHPKTSYKASKQQYIRSEFSARCMDPFVPIDDANVCIKG